MQSWRRLSFLPLLCLAGTCRTHQVPAALVPSGESLPNWDYRAAASIVYQPPASGCEPHPIRGSLIGLQLLAWRLIDRPEGARDEALWWAYWLTPDGPTWLLAMTFRDELRDRPGTWKFARTDPGTGPCGRSIYQRLATAPTNREVLAFFHALNANAVMRTPAGIDPGTWFHPWILPGSRWALTEVVVRARAWALALGEPPPAEFQP